MLSICLQHAETEANFSYTGGPVIAVMNTGSNIVHELAVCTSCRIKRYHVSC